MTERGSNVVEVLFGESEKCALKLAHRSLGKAIGGVSAPIGIVFENSDGVPPTQEEREAAMEYARREAQREQERRQEMIPVGTADGEVLGLDFMLDVGDISENTPGPVRRALLQEWMCAGPWRNGAAEEWKKSADRHWRNAAEDLNTLHRRAKAGEPVRIWYSDTPYSMCGLYFTVAQLSMYSCPISVVKLPPWELCACRNEGMEYPETLQMLEVGSRISWGDAPPDAFGRHLAREQALAPAARQMLTGLWRLLQQENAPLRAVVNGRLQSVGEDFYDTFLRREPMPETFRVAELVGRVLGRRLVIGDWVLARRICVLLAAGELELVEEKPQFYAAVLRRRA